MREEEAARDRPNKCFECGDLACWRVLVAQEQLGEPPREEWSCDVHARDHWRCALVTPVTTDDVTAIEVEAGDARYAW